jgi:hypothetical protein
MVWAPAVAFGPSLLVTRDFVAAGFDVGVGIHHYRDYNRRPLTDSTAAAVASLGLLALPRGALLGNEHGIDLISRPYFLSGHRSLIETSLRPVSRVLIADSRVSLPSVLGALIPAIGVLGFASEDKSPSATFHGAYQAFLTRWSFDARVIFVPKPVLLFVEIEPSVEILMPFNGAATHAVFGANLNVGFGVLEN